jgi:DNA-binding FadR family transcriptional regulator
MKRKPKAMLQLQNRMGPFANSIRRDRLHDQITRSIALQILGSSPDELAGVLTSEVNLSRHLNVSRSVLREAVKVLAAKGLIEVRPKTGMRVRPRTDWNLLDPDLLQWQCQAGVDESMVRNLCQVRFVLEPPTAELAASQATSKEIELIQRLYRDMECYIEDFDAFVNADVAFHEAISSATHNDLLIQINRTIMAALRATQDIFKHHRAGAVRALPLHKQVADAIAARDSNAALNAMAQLVKQAERDIYLEVHAGNAQKRES